MAGRGADRVGVVHPEVIFAKLIEVCQRNPAFDAHVVEGNTADEDPDLDVHIIGYGLGHHLVFPELAVGVALYDPMVTLSLRVRRENLQHCLRT